MLSKNQIKLIKSLSLKKNRVAHQLFTVEGTKGILEFLQSNFKCRALYTTDSNLFGEYEVTLISEKDLARITKLKSANQSLAVFEIPKNNSLDEEQFIVALDDIKDPGNLGTIIRLCDWFGISQILCSEETVDCYNSKVVQASMGSLARVNLVYTNLESFLKHYSGEVYGTYLDGESIYKNTYKDKGLLLMGNEANGISAKMKTFVDKKVTIPQYGDGGSTESLNVATATAICLAELKRTTI